MLSNTILLLLEVGCLKVALRLGAHLLLFCFKNFEEYRILFEPFSKVAFKTFRNLALVPYKAVNSAIGKKVDTSCHCWPYLDKSSQVPPSCRDKCQ
jgi:hypothetical protein